MHSISYILFISKLSNKARVTSTLSDSYAKISILLSKPPVCRSITQYCMQKVLVYNFLKLIGNAVLFPMTIL